MKPFDLEKAKNGAAVCMRDGTPVKILDTDYNGYILYKYPLLDSDGTLKNEYSIMHVDQDGKFIFLKGEERKWSDFDLFMVPTIGYMNIYKLTDRKDERLEGSMLHPDIESCQANRLSHNCFFCMAKVELLDNENFTFDSQPEETHGTIDDTPF